MSFLLSRNDTRNAFVRAKYSTIKNKNNILTGYYQANTKLITVIH